MSLNLTGYVGSTPVLKEAGEQRVASFSLTVNRKTSSGKQQTLWVRMNCWNGLSDVAMKFAQGFTVPVRGYLDALKCMDRQERRTACQPGHRR